MPDRRGRKGSVDDLLPKDRIPWAREIWADREEVAKWDNGPRGRESLDAARGGEGARAACREETVDELLRCVFRPGASSSFAATTMTSKWELKHPLTLALVVTVFIGLLTLAVLRLVKGAFIGHLWAEREVDRGA
jgi:hypothetical protein